MFPIKSISFLTLAFFVPLVVENTNAFSNYSKCLIQLDNEGFILNQAGVNAFVYAYEYLLHKEARGDNKGFLKAYFQYLIQETMKYFTNRAFSQPLAWCKANTVLLRINVNPLQYNCVCSKLVHESSYRYVNTEKQALEHGYRYLTKAILELDNINVLEKKYYLHWKNAVVTHPNASLLDGPGEFCLKSTNKIILKSTTKSVAHEVENTIPNTDQGNNLTALNLFPVTNVDNNNMPQASTSVVPQHKYESLYQDNTGYWYFPSASTSHGVENIYQDNTGHWDFPLASTSHGVENIYQGTFNIMPQASTSAVPEHENESFHQGGSNLLNLFPDTYMNNNIISQASTSAVPQHEYEYLYQDNTGYWNFPSASTLHGVENIHKSYNFMPQASTSANPQREDVELHSENEEVNLNLSLNVKKT